MRLGRSLPRLHLQSIVRHRTGLEEVAATTTVSQCDCDRRSDINGIVWGPVTSARVTTAAVEAVEPQMSSTLGSIGEGVLFVILF